MALTVTGLERTRSDDRIFCLRFFREDLTNPIAAIPPIDAGLIKLYDDIRTTVDQEAEIISMVFPNPAAVFQVFIQRVFGQSVSFLLIFSMQSKLFSDDMFILVNPNIDISGTAMIDSAIHRNIAGEGSGEINIGVLAHTARDP